MRGLGFSHRTGRGAPLLTAVLLLGQLCASARLRAAPASVEPEIDEEKSEPPAGPFRLHDALRAPDWLVLSGSQRSRYSGLANQFRPVPDRADQAVSLRTLLTLGATLGPVSVAVELQDARAYLTDEYSAVSTIVVNALEPLSAYVQLHLDDTLRRGRSWEVRAGRQTLDLGGRRLVARNRFRNTIQSFDGVTSEWRTDTGAALFVFALLPVRVRPSNLERAALLDNRIEIDRESLDLGLWGALYAQPVGSGISLEAYFIGLNEADGRGFPTPNRQLYTPGVRAVRDPAAADWDLELESVFQTGKRRNSVNPADTRDHAVRAFFQHASIGYTFAVPWSPRLSAELDYATGDDPTSGRYERFDTLYGPRRAEFGPTGIYGLLGRENILSTGARLQVEPHDRVDGFVSWRANWLADARDMFARTGLQDPSGQSGKFAGHQVEVRSRVWLIPESIRWELGGAAFFEGSFMRKAPNATGNGNPLFIYTDLELFF